MSCSGLEAGSYLYFTSSNEGMISGASFGMRAKLNKRSRSRTTSRREARILFSTYKDSDRDDNAKQDQRGTAQHEAKIEIADLAQKETNCVHMPTCFFAAKNVLVSGRAWPRHFEVDIDLQGGATV